MFAYNCIIFAKASKRACSNNNKILHNFCALSRQLVNFHKSSIRFLNNIQGAMKRMLGEALSITICTGISNYLGYPITQSRVKRSTFF